MPFKQKPTRFARVLICSAIQVFIIGGQISDQRGPRNGEPQIGDKPVDLKGLHNVIRVSDRLYSGGVPEGSAGFDSLKALGVRTILSVDGSRPDVDRARGFGMRYIHLPIGYEGIKQDQVLKLARAVRDLPGPIYIHCHHGKHRSPAAAAAVQICLDEKCTVAQAVEIMKRAGTDPRYSGLFATPRDVKRPTAKDLDMVSADFKEVVEIPVLAKAMVQIDQHWDNLTLIKKAGWKTPKEHPDLDPPHEALQVWEYYRELARSPATQNRPADFRAWLADSEEAAKQLENELRERPKSDSTSVDEAFQRLRALCTRCHAKYRDVPQGK
jgi:protein tyrosine phosphatase (PTP) superfamily phosphohydrolase (DUF442 family)